MEVLLAEQFELKHMGMYSMRQFRYEFDSLTDPFWWFSSFFFLFGFFFANLMAVKHPLCMAFLQDIILFVLSSHYNDANFENNTQYDQGQE